MMVCCGDTAFAYMPEPCFPGSCDIVFVFESAVNTKSTKVKEDNVRMIGCSRLRVIVIEPSAAGNVGWIARAMTNFGASELVVVNPADFDRNISRDFACHGAGVIDAMHTVSSLDEALQGVSFTVGTTRRIGRNDPVCSARKGAAALADRLHRGAAAIVFGRERSGLTKEEKSRCDLLASIETVSGADGSLNISHAAVLFFYEISQAMMDERSCPAADTAPAEAAFDRALSAMPGYTDGGVYQAVFHAVLSRACPTENEVARLRAACDLLYRGGKTQP